MLAVLTLASAFVFAPAAIVLGHLAKRQIRQTGADGWALADWGLFLGYLGTVVGLLCCCGLLVVTIRSAGLGLP